MDCPHCRGEITISPEHWGRTWTCPHCLKPFEATQPAASAASSPINPTTVTAAGARQSVATCRNCRQRYYLVSDPAANRCPSCGTPAVAFTGASTGLSAFGTPPYIAPRSSAPSHAMPATRAMHSPFAPASALDRAHMNSQASTIQGCMLACGIVNLVIGCLLIFTCYGAILGIPMVILAAFELAHQGKKSSMSPYAFGSSSIPLAIFEIIAGLFNLVSLILGIIVLANAMSLKSTCERLQVYT